MERCCIDSHDHRRLLAAAYLWPALLEAPALAALWEQVVYETLSEYDAGDSLAPLRLVAACPWFFYWDLIFSALDEIMFTQDWRKHLAALRREARRPPVPMQLRARLITKVTSARASGQPPAQALSSMAAKLGLRSPGRARSLYYDSRKLIPLPPFAITDQGRALIIVARPGRQGELEAQQMARSLGAGLEEGHTLGADPQQRTLGPRIQEYLRAISEEPRYKELADATRHRLADLPPGPYPIIVVASEPTWLALLDPPRRVPREDQTDRLRSECRAARRRWIAGDEAAVVEHASECGYCWEMTTWVAGGLVRLFLRGTWAKVFLRAAAKPREQDWAFREWIFATVEAVRRSGKGPTEALREVKRRADEDWRLMGQPEWRKPYSFATLRTRYYEARKRRFGPTRRLGPMWRRRIGTLARATPRQAVSGSKDLVKISQSRE